MSKRNQKKYILLDKLEEKLKDGFIRELKILAESQNPKEILNSLYIFKRLYPNAVNHVYTENADVLLKTEKDIIALRASLNDNHSEVLILVNKFEDLYKAHSENSGNIWRYTAREILRMRHS